jgi:uncharacterized protein (TIRG00374 family)
MAPATKKWSLRFVKFAVCVGALWYLSDKVALQDHVRLGDSPGKQYILVGESDDTLRIRDPATGEQREVSMAATPGGLEGSGLRIERGLRYVVGHTKWSWALWAFLAMGPATFVLAWRLRLLLSTQEISISRRDAILLTFAGGFFNFALPGVTGGDFYKAYHIARLTHKGAEGVAIVFLDRAFGLISFLLLAVGAIFVSSGMDLIGVYGRWVGYLMVAFMAACGLFFSRRFRQWIRYGDILRRLPFGDKLRRIDDTAFGLRHHPAKTVLALLVTIFFHFVFVFAVYCLARGLGISAGPGRTEGGLYLACLLAFIVGYLFAVVPISVQGFGIVEAVFIRVLVEGRWCSMNQMLALTLGIRILQIIWALPGVAAPWMGFHRPRGGFDGDPHG